MSNELVKYQPELNTIHLRKFSPGEMNLFFSIVSRIRDKGDQTVRFRFDQLKELNN
ncbi:RepB family plasmid replication initiator protein, partial [Lactiplantibacillus plantarum]|uniref:RepB family plasmid replication initiator protein n=1 Tax=Lactiplantibacillus plantarum TaxID=1590 RepID=UPI003C1D43D4